MCLHFFVVYNLNVDIQKGDFGVHSIRNKTVRVQMNQYLFFRNIDEVYNHYALILLPITGRTIIYWFECKFIVWNSVLKKMDWTSGRHGGSWSIRQKWSNEGSKKGLKWKKKLFINLKWRIFWSGDTKSSFIRMSIDEHPFTKLINKSTSILQSSFSDIHSFAL